MAKSRLSHEEKLMCGLVVDSGVSLKEGMQEDERKADEARPKKGFVPIEEIGVEHAILSRLSASQIRDCSDPLYSLPRNMRLA